MPDVEAMCSRIEPLTPPNLQIVAYPRPTRTLTMLTWFQKHVCIASLRVVVAFLVVIVGSASCMTGWLVSQCVGFRWGLVGQGVGVLPHLQVAGRGIDFTVVRWFWVFWVVRVVHV